ncbi:MAG: aminodeoxychorismate synthase component I [Gammaproteobacteria bacterium]|nr:aminodeoxychorismate synthase component I [Gammaproteobacteria bacterium]
MSFQTRLLSDHLDLTVLCKTRPEQYPYALVSTSSSDARLRDRYDIFFAYPQECLTLDKDQLLSFTGEPALAIGDGFLNSFDHWWQKEKIQTQQTELPFTGGWFIYLSYEMAVEIEPTLKLPKPNELSLNNNIPLAIAKRCPAAIIVDHLRNTITAVAENEYANLLDQIENDVAELGCNSDLIQPTKINCHAICESPEAPYLEQVNTIKNYIIEGDIFQANLSRPWLIEINNVINDVDIFNALSTSNPGSFAAFARLGDACLMSSSPERLVSSRKNIIETRPIAGTRPRSSTHDNDAAITKELLEHPKEQAEHIMLIDLERNDLGRVCKPGTIRVSELMGLESYQHVHHIVSNIQGMIKDQLTPVDVIKAVFPGGTITGCPKVRCMEILSEMEQEQRGAYTGSVGYINRDGSMDLNILIRTMLRAGNKISFRAGGGIVADSDPQRELEETRAKAKGLVNIFNLNT